MSSYSSDEEDVRPVHADALREKEAYTRPLMDMIRESKRKEMEKKRQEREEKFQKMLEASANEVNNHVTKKHEETQAVLTKVIQQEGSKTETQLTSLQDQVKSEGALLKDVIQQEGSELKDTVAKTATKLELIQQQGDKTANNLNDVSKQLRFLTDLVEQQSAKKKDRPFKQSDIDDLLDDDSTVANMISLKSALASESVHSPLSAGTNDDELCNQKKRSPSPLKEEETGPPMKKRLKSMFGGLKNTISGKKNS